MFLNEFDKFSLSPPSNQTNTPQLSLKLPTETRDFLKALPETPIQSLQGATADAFQWQKTMTVFSDHSYNTKKMVSPKLASYSDAWIGTWLKSWPLEGSMGRLYIYTYHLTTQNSPIM